MHIFKVSSSEVLSSDIDLQCQSWMRKIARASGQLPSSLFITDDVKVPQYPFTGGGNADIFIGTYKGEEVAVKALRLFAFRDESDQMHHVYPQFLAFAIPKTYILDS